MIKPGQEMTSLFREFSLPIIEPNFKYAWCMGLALSSFDFCRCCGLHWWKSIPQDSATEGNYSLVLCGPQTEINMQNVLKRGMLNEIPIYTSLKFPFTKQSETA